MAFYISLLGLVGTMASDLLSRVRPEPAGLGAVVDLACERLRRDLAAGARSEGDTLIAGDACWQVLGGRLQRDGIAGAAVRSAVWERRAGRWVVTLTPLRGRPRQVAVSAPELAP